MSPEHLREKGGATVEGYQVLFRIKLPSVSAHQLQDMLDEMVAADFRRMRAMRSLASARSEI